MCNSFFHRFSTGFDVLTTNNSPLDPVIMILLLIDWVKIVRGGRCPNPIPASMTKKQQPVAAPRTKIGEKQRALKGFTKSYEIKLKTDRDALVQLKKYETGN